MFNPYEITSTMPIHDSAAQNLLVPTVTEVSNGMMRSYDLFSRLLKDRIVMLCGEVNDASAQLIIGQMLFLESEDPEADIYLYINSPGGSVSAGLAIFDTMNYIKCDVVTICFGIAASMGAFLLSSGAKDKRYCLPNAEVMIHQPLGGAQGQASEIAIQAEHMAKTKDRLTRILCENTGKTKEEMLAATDRDNWLSADEAVKFGLVDKIETKHK